MDLVLVPLVTTDSMILGVQLPHVTMDSMILGVQLRKVEDSVLLSIDQGDVVSKQLRVCFTLSFINLYSCKSGGTLTLLG